MPNANGHRCILAPRALFQGLHDRGGVERLQDVKNVFAGGGSDGRREDQNNIFDPFANTAATGSHQAFLQTSK